MSDNQANANAIAAIGRSQISRIAFETMYEVLVDNSGILGGEWFISFYDKFSQRIQALSQMLVNSDGLPEMNYPFEVFQRGSTNVGLRLIYRQLWTPLGAQPGEIVRTIPLGPGEKQRVSTKIVRRRKAANSLEAASAAESSTETSDSTKDSNEIVNETGSTFNWNESLNVHASFGDLFGGSSTTNFGGTSEDKSKNTARMALLGMAEVLHAIRLLPGHRRCHDVRHGQSRHLRAQSTTLLTGP
jgi:hypothetical protein